MGVKLMSPLLPAMVVVAVRIKQKGSGRLWEKMKAAALAFG